MPELISCRVLARFVRMCPRSARFHYTFSEADILDAGFLAIETALKTIHEHKDDPEYLELRWNPKLKKNLLKIDEFAQTAAEAALKVRLPDAVEIRGEESSLEDLTYRLEVAALLDMVDGTDLLERGLWNWCSAMVLFNRQQVWASLIGMPNREIYYERFSEAGAFVREPRKAESAPQIQTVTVKEKPDIRLQDASIAFYGQKPKSLLTTVRHGGLAKALDQIAQEAQAKRDQPDAPKFRIYNLAGNPMMMQLIEGKIDAVIELSGQRCHDVIPGFAIALKAGAKLFDWETRNEITTKDLPNMLASPKNKFKYVMACNEQLAVEIVDVLNGA